MLHVGLILYSVRQAMEKDPLGVVAQVARMGYRNIEVCNHHADTDNGIGFGVEAQPLREIFDSYGSRVVSAHIYPFDQCDTSAVLAYQRVLGNRNIVNPMDHFETYDILMQKCEYYNRMGRLCRDEGFQYLYHNHNQEFRTFNGKFVLDYIVENTDPDCVGLELDTFWVMRAGLDPVEMLRHYGKRVKLIHQKDFARDALVPINTIGITPEQRETGSEFSQRPAPWTMEEGRTAFTEIGTGMMDIQSIINEANASTDATHIILEQDATRMPTELDSIARSMEAFRRFEGISWD